MTSVHRLAVLTCAGLVATTVAGCGSVTKAVTGSDPGGAIVMGTTSVTNVLDPAGAYDNGSWLLLHNTFQSLLKFPAASTSPVPDAAQSCEFTGADATTYHCTLRPGLKFSNGHALTAQDVVFSIDRMTKIKDENGPSSLLDSVKSVEAKGDSEVVFHLSQPDAVLPAKLASAAGSIVDHQVFPADKLLANDKLVGSGPYKIDSLEDMASDGGTKVPGRVTLVANDEYKGDELLRNKKFTLRYFNKGSDLKAALDSGEVDLTDNSLDPGAAAGYMADVQAGKTAVQVADGESSETRYLAFNTKDPVTGNPAVRQAVAQLLDRKVLARDVYARTVQPLYSVVPAGVLGHNTAFFDRYGDPDIAKAKQILTAAKVALPVKMSLTWSRARAEGAESAEIKKQLEASGLFQVTVQQESDWDKFKKGWTAGIYQAYTIGWTADYPDPDNFVAPLVVNGGAYHTGWNDPRISDKLVPESLVQADRSAAGPTFAQMQNITAEGVPLIPIFQAKAFYASRSNITGVESTVDTTGVFRFWEIGRSK
ncbi:ABC transporter substrate-binding protein [Kitasatospora sp. NPDC057223]|uniref:ABC transporter substrate-binding protein n=1 Tax=Kitasatospora sp. NPDC057223 TaxID=3346055 RepID=UPI00364457D8